MPPVIKTIGPLHLEDLEPHRFEDLVRQLAYDFRPWVSIEPTGRGGSDDGYDARAWERIDTSEERDDDDEQGPPASRVWLVQCKREKQISPKKLRDYLDGLPQDAQEPIYGIIFAAACDFSKMARDVFRTRTRELGFSEAYLWGKADIEDQLFQPKNDHLLFAYCGFSLQVRKRSLKTEIRALIATKKRAQKLLDNGRTVLVRDPTDERYPYLDEDKSLKREQRGRWKTFERGECKYNGIHFYWRRKFAFIDKDGVHWDIADAMNDALPNSIFDPWSDEELVEKIRKGRNAASDVWNALPVDERAFIEAHLILPYENVIAFDDDGDDMFEGPVIFTGPWVNDWPFREAYTYVLATTGTLDSGPRHCVIDPDTRVKKFARIEEEE